ncbi:hypothetical protein ADEAN_000232700 [Angomonas deanei]|uniref:Uncharacterized protein n=1 Tax=Angomonas deanei TaxID=59799 RepID=A0A7G2C6Z9_9TRYP|nr:hypothetical protein ADEAN_000232700 [Angomonas deanei]
MVKVPNYLLEEIEASKQESVPRKPFFHNSDALCSFLNEIREKLETDYTSYSRLVHYFSEYENYIWREIHTYVTEEPFVSSSVVTKTITHTWSTLLKRTLVLSDWSNGIEFLNYAKRTFLAVAPLPTSVPLKAAVYDASLSFISQLSKNLLSVIHERSISLSSYTPPRRTFLALEELRSAVEVVLCCVGDSESSTKSAKRLSKEVEFSANFLRETFVEKVICEVILSEYMCVNWRNTSMVFTVRQIHPSVWMFFTLVHCIVTEIAQNVNDGDPEDRYSRRIAGDIISEMIRQFTAGLVNIVGGHCNANNFSEMPPERRTQFIRDVLCFTLLARSLRHISLDHNNEACLSYFLRFTHRYLFDDVFAATVGEATDNAKSGWDTIWNVKPLAYAQLLDAKCCKVPFGINSPLANTLVYFGTLPHVSTFKQIVTQLEEA